MPVAMLKQKILPVIFKYAPKDGCAVFLFGSFARQAAARSSDLDIGIVCANPLERLALIKIKEELEELTLREVDFTDFSAVTDEDFLKLALRRIKIWHQTKSSKVYLANLRRRAKG
jgi:predicted nucleotidyltransferase